ncbi:MAG: hypothetical protein GXO22_04305 [Aquificae bacterium]|nr:hypothetical protein [Aquificota bacterium]
MFKAKILAQDYFVFGNGKPFNAGENVFRFNDVIILNTHIYSALKKRFSSLNINFIGIHKFLYNTFYFPFPIDYIYYLSKHGIPKPIANIKIPNIEILKEDDFRIYLKGEHFKGEFGITSLKTKRLKIWRKDKHNLKKVKEKLNSLKEFKILSIKLETGLEIDRKTNTAKEGNLYIESRSYFSSEKGYVDIDIIVAFSGKSKKSFDKNDYIVDFAGESKTAQIFIDEIEEFNELSLPEEDIKEKIKENQYFKIILLTPTNYPPKIEGAELVAQLIGKPIAFSGWFNVYDDGKKIDSFPSRLFKLIPAGSVFYYELKDESKLDDIFDKYWLKPAFFVKEYPYFEEKEEENPQSKEKIKINPLGFGLSIIGVAQVE